MSNNKITKTEQKNINKMFWRSFTLYASFGYANHGATGFLYSVLPFLEENYEGEELKQAMERNIVWFNTTHPFSTFIMGLVASMEKENSENPNFDTESINAVKTSLMGPLAGIGDSLFWGILRIIAAGIAIGLGTQGNILAPIAFILIYNVPSIALRYFNAKTGYMLGSSYLEKVYESGLIHILTKAASSLGLFMIGAMSVSFISFNTSLEIVFSADNIMVVQEVLDQIFVGLIPLVYTLGSHYLMSKKKWSFNRILIITIAICLVLSFIGVV